MNAKHVLTTLLISTLGVGGCGLLDDLEDLGDDDDDTGSDENGGDDEDESEDDDAEETGGDGPHEPTSDDPQPTGDDDPQPPDDSADTSGGHASDPGESSTGAEGPAACAEGEQACVDELTIAVCYEGELVAIDCNEACIEGGYVGTLGCFYDEESGVDTCWCDDGSGSGSGSEGGA